jgi:hypothetical protein
MRYPWYWISGHQLGLREINKRSVSASIKVSGLEVDIDRKRKL